MIISLKDYPTLAILLRSGNLRKQQKLVINLRAFVTANSHPQPILLSRIGINVLRELGDTVNCKTATNEYHLELFDGPVTLRDRKNKLTYNTTVFIVYTPGQSRYFRAEGSLRHTWFQASGDGVAECIDEYKIPVNCPIEVNSPINLTQLLKKAQGEIVSKNTHWEDALTELGRSIFRHLARSVYQPVCPFKSSPVYRDSLAILHGVRAQVYKELNIKWTVEDMAVLANMSPARFATAYRSAFKKSPIDDLIDFRLRYAEVLLRHLPLSIEKTAALSGFNSSSNFHVMLRDRTGKSPRDLRKMNGRSVKPTMDRDDPFEDWEAGQKVSLLYIRPVGHWSFDRDDEVIDDLRKHSAAVLQNDVRKNPGRIMGQALHLSGEGYAVLQETAVDTSRSYTVCSWLRPEKQSRMTAISIGNSHHGAFYLQYIASDGGFRFATTVSDRDPFALYIASSEPSIEGEWYHVAGIHDLDKHEIRLYVNGKFQGKAEYSTPWRAEGSTFFGCCQIMDATADHWQGDIDDVRIYDAVLSDAEIETLYREHDILTPS